MGKVIGCLGAAALLALLINLQAEGALAVPFNIGCGGQANIDTDPATLITCTVGSVGAINDLTVVLGIDDVPGTPYVSDLEITLTHDSSGVSVVLYLGALVASPSSFMDATFDDGAAALAPTWGNVVGTFLPVDALSAFDGLELSGDWTLSLHDLTIWTDEGLDLINWGLVGDQVPDPSTALLLAIGLLGIAVAGGRPAARRESSARHISPPQ